MKYDAVVQAVLTAAMAVLTLGTVACLVRAVIGPTNADRYAGDLPDLHPRRPDRGTRVYGRGADFCNVQFPCGSGAGKDCYGKEKRQMTFAEWLKLAAGVILTAGGLFVFVTSVIGNYRFPDAATRMHSAALGDTLGILLVFAGLAVLCFSAGFALKLGIIVLLMWVSGPACSHLIAGMIAGERPEKKEAKQKK